MSMFGGRAPSGRVDEGQTVASFGTYEDAQKSVSALITGEVPARDIAIVGRGLRSVERVTGRLGYAAAARTGAVNGMLLGLFFSAILVIGTPSPPIQVFVGVVFVGIAIGMLLSIVTYSLVRRRRDFASVMQVVADAYEVTVTAASIQRARQIVGPSASAPAPAPAAVSAPTGPAQAPAAEEPPRYGERVTVPAAGAESADAGEDSAPRDAAPATPEHATRRSQRAAAGGTAPVAEGTAPPVAGDDTVPAGDGEDTPDRPSQPA